MNRILKPSRQGVLLLILSISSFLQSCIKLPKTNNFNPVLLIILFTCAIAIGIIFLIFLRLTLSKKPKSEVYSRNEINDQKYIQRIRQLENELVRYKAENKVLHSKIEMLGNTSNQLNSDQAPKDEILNEPQEIKQENNEANEVILYDSQSPVSIEFYESHDCGVFDKRTSKSKDFPRAVFKIDATNSEGILGILTGRMDATIIADRDIFLENVCDITTISGGNRDKIRVVDNGKVLLQEGDRWVVIKKIKVEIL